MSIGDMAMSAALQDEKRELRYAIKTLRNALENSNSLFAAMLHEKRPDAEIEAQIYENRSAAVSAAGDSRMVDIIANIISDYYDEDAGGRWRKCAEHIASSLFSQERQSHE